MPRARSETPDAKLEYSAGCWRVYWRWGGEKYSAAVGLNTRGDRKEAEPIRRAVANELAKEKPVFPPEIAGSRAVARYLEKRYPSSIADTNLAAPHDWLKEYAEYIDNEVGAAWAKNSFAMLTRLEAFINGKRLPPTVKAAKTAIEAMLLDGIEPRRVGTTTNEEAKAFLLDIVKSGGSPAGRNRALAMCNRFFKWAMHSKGATNNPCAGLKLLDEEKPGEISYCTRAERARILAVARATGRPDWLAIPIAFYAGCRRGEIYTAIRWEDVNFDNCRLTIRKTKTKEPRTLPMASELVAILRQPRRGRGSVIAKDGEETWMNQADRLVELIREQLCPPKNPGADGRPREAVGKRTFLMTADEVRECRDQREADTPGQGIAWDGGEWLPGERVGWTVFRHTFGSLLAQAGVGLDKISAWMGNTPEVCRRHYTQFVPRDHRDDEIDKL